MHQIKHTKRLQLKHTKYIQRRGRKELTHGHGCLPAEEGGHLMLHRRTTTRRRSQWWVAAVRDGERERYRISYYEMKVIRITV